MPKPTDRTKPWKQKFFDIVPMRDENGNVLTERPIVKIHVPLVKRLPDPHRSHSGNQNNHEPKKRNPKTD